MKETSAIKQYRALRPSYELYCNKLKNLLEELLKNAGIPFHVVEARAKTVESFSEKASRKGKGYKNPLVEVTDLAALRIIVYYQDDVDAVAKLIDSEFKVDPTKSVDKRLELAPDQFGYISVHKIVNLSNRRAELSEWRSCSTLTAEVQIRTVLQHAWAAIDHALQYKGTVKGSSSFTRRLMRLSGLMELADEEFQTLKGEREVIERETSEQFAKGNLNIPVDTLSLSRYGEHSAILEQIGDAARSAGIIDQDFEVEDQQPDGSDLVGACEMLGISTIDQLQSVMKLRAPKAKRFFIEFMKQQESQPYGSSLHAAAMLLIGTAAPAPAAKIVGRHTGWANDYCVEVLDAGKQVI